MNMKMTFSGRSFVYGLFAFVLLLLGITVSCAVSVDDQTTVYVPVSSGVNTSSQTVNSDAGILEYGREGQDLNLHLNVGYAPVRSALPSDLSSVFSDTTVKFKARILRGSTLIAESTANKIEETVGGVTNYKLVFSFPGLVSTFISVYKVQVYLVNVSDDVKLMETNEVEVTISSNVKSYEDTVNTYCLYPTADSALGPAGSIEVKVKCDSGFDFSVTGLPSGVTVSSASGIHTIAGTNVTPGTYEAVFSLKKNGEVLYSWKESIIVYPGLKTDRWSSTSVSATDKNLKDLTGIGRTEFYVRSATNSSASLWTTYSSSAGDDTAGNGSIKKPYATIQKAIIAVNAISSAYTVQPEFTIYCDGEFVTYDGNTSGSVVDFQGSLINLRIIGIGSTKSVLDGSGQIKTVLFTSGNSLYLENLTIKNGQDGTGGGMYVMGSGITSLKNCCITDCRATGGTARGGGIFVTAATLKFLEGVEIVNNYSELSGAGIYMNSGTLDLYSSVNVDGNESVGTGSGIYKSDFAALKVRGTAITNGNDSGLDLIEGINNCEDIFFQNSFLRLNTPSENKDFNSSRINKMMTNTSGGYDLYLGKSTTSETLFELGDCITFPATYMYLRCSSFDDSAEKRENRVVLKGKGIKTAASKAWMYGIKILGASGDGNGGGINCVGSSELEMNYCDIDSCSTPSGTYNGGGIYMTGTSRLTMKHGYIIKCRSSSMGDGIYIASNASVTLEDVLISLNTNNDKRGVYDAGNLTIKGSTVITSDNVVYLTNSSKVTIDGTLTGEIPVATIKPYDQIDGVQVLDNSNLANNYYKFAVPNKTIVVSGVSCSKWKIDSNGCLAVCTNNVSDLTVAPTSGTYSVYDQDGLEKISEFVGSGSSLQGCVFNLEDDIKTEGDFTPIGGGASYNSNPFKGTFDGYGHTISGIDLTNVSGVVYPAVFSSVGQNAVIKNLTVEGTGEAGLIGHLAYGTVENCVNRINVKQTGSHSVGGIVCSLQNSGKVLNCINEGSVTSSYNYAGGIVGNANYPDTLIDGCINRGSINGQIYTGGITGDSFCNIRNCLNEGAVSGASRVGGISGSVDTSSDKGIRNCQNKGKITGVSLTGGIVGCADISSSNYSAYIYNTKNSGLVYRKSGTSTTFGSILGGVLTGSSGTVYMDCNYYDSSVSPKTGIGCDVSTYSDAKQPYPYVESTKKVNGTVTINATDYTGPLVDAILNKWITESADPSLYVNWDSSGNLQLP